MNWRDVLLDLRTIYLAGAITALILGFVQLAAYATGRFERWPLWWGLSNLLIGLGLIGVGLRDIIPDLISIPLANTVSWIGYLLVLYGVRSFGGRPARLPLYALAIAAAAIPLALWNEPDGFVRRVVLVSVLVMACDTLLVREGLLLWRRERLVSGAILAALFAPTVLLFALRAWLAMTGQLGAELFPADNADPWFAATGTAFVLLRSGALLLLAAERSRNRLVTIAQHDPLTGAMNRSGLERAMAQIAADAGKRPGRLTLLLIDIDHFKSLNDTHGHAAGDRILQLFAGAARSELRASDILARHGGDEFVALLPHMSAKDAVRVANRIRAAFGRALTDWDSVTLQPTLSIGVAEGDAASDELEALLEQADEALYRSKRLGRDRVQVQIRALAR
ncbi:Diguanylate cyclase (GGDEF) domain-containing protein [Bosea sp. 62]|uniref:GGDEF domain-containing protein n=1 Tax=unclassified Bosea (in: a-proteobacteria) TaxID=2653178 RepID=UPI001257D6F7|nr:MULTISPECIES: GGDEF domain-containing protein [unclassified Bosea (in: a-proteobacteria)]CAD5259923.1 Diguanylate cyclase (GGDEF) domain-containing protein [Bosea sp. 46]CAD5264371.1 Diguanylate cyclase (GGDEF) domain-containing protein [Bosea sp. 21B]CAD5275953.1 Diguanylate cyclase (GGDEF) domain-containing protein [Bosea sp. 7B]VVT59099.1 Diguanylate cyclase (GGDEF) domain-containing protein [Bosea sp. EC-HK365B]VXB68885.1 Diguanylate cyclase (GGDEF) domain-containing protein [Bosea sp. 